MNQDRIFNLMFDYVTSNKLEKAKLLLEKCPTSFLSNTEGEKATLLHIAARHASPDFIKMFVQAGMGIDVIDGSQCTPLQAAICSQRHENIKVLLELGADTEKRCLGVTALHAAVFNELRVKLPHMTRMLVNSGRANLEALNDGETPLYYAARSGSAGTVSALLEAGADPKFTFDGKTPLKAAQNKRHKEVVETIKTWLAAHKAHLAVDAVLNNKQGFQPL